ncbi:MAG: SUMF1/EgtB/PvdO family nonheme iron enzyme, partial [Rhodospirillaceae bacterium]|nr:SUMF1/EgtB/PvdO family nonheme iron enzyme [Rhodospirillaceae bacterium]
DCWNDNYNGAPANGAARIEGSCSRRVDRGGSWLDRPGYLRSAYRSKSDPTFRYDDLGFRIARGL